MGNVSRSGIIDSTTAEQIVGKAMTTREVVELSESFATLADPNRLRLLDLLSGKEQVPLCVSDLAAMSGTDISSTSHHLQKAKKAGLVKSHRFDKHAIYELTPEGKQLMTVARNALAAPTGI